MANTSFCNAKKRERERKFSTCVGVDANYLFEAFYLQLTKLPFDELKTSKPCGSLVRNLMPIIPACAASQSGSTWNNFEGEIAITSYTLYDHPKIFFSIFFATKCVFCLPSRERSRVHSYYKRTVLSKLDRIEMLNSARCKGVGSFKIECKSSPGSRNVRISIWRNSWASWREHLQIA